MSLKAIALLFAILLAANALVINKHEDGSGDSDSNWDDDEDFSQVDTSEYGQDDEGENPAHTLNEDQTQLVADAIAELPWFGDISAENQKAVKRIFTNFMEQGDKADTDILIAELCAIEEVKPYVVAMIEEAAAENHLRVAFAPTSHQSYGHKWLGSGYGGYRYLHHR